MCTARQDRACGSPYVRIEDAEAAVLQHYMTLRLPGGFAARVREVLKATLGDEQQSTRLMHEHLTKTLRDLEAKEENLLDLVETGAAVAAKVRARLVAIGEERVRVKAELAEQKPQLEVGAALIRAALDLLDDPQELYRQTNDPVRRQLNQMFFDKLYLEARERSPTTSWLSRSTGSWITAVLDSESFTRAAMIGQTKTAPEGRCELNKCRCRPARTHCVRSNE